MEVEKNYKKIDWMSLDNLYRCATLHVGMSAVDLPDGREIISCQCGKKRITDPEKVKKWKAYQITKKLTS